MAEKSCEIALTRTTSAKVAGGSSCFDSSTLLSEPPDIRNWFSSYVYHSPDLDSVAGSLFAGKEESECCDLYVEDSEAEEDPEEKKTDIASFGNCFAQKTEFNWSTTHIIADKVHHESKSELQLEEYSESLPSEPLDIRNWFSSYTYESPPDLDSIKIGASVIDTPTDGSSEDIGIENEEQTLRKLNPSKAEDDTAHPHSLPFMGTIKRKKSFRDELNAIHSDHKGEELADDNNHGTDTVTRVEDPIYEDERCIQKLDADQITGGENSAQVKCHNESGKDPQSSKPCSIRECSGKGAQRINGESDKVFNQVDSGWILPNPKWRERSRSNLNEETRYKKWQEDDGRGFTSMRKIRSHQMIKDENAMETNHRERYHKSQVALAVSKKGEETAIQRTVLAEVANLQQPYVSAPGVTVGKWKCPQKTKPYIGPPLKQLRLEKWVQRL